MTTATAAPYTQAGGTAASWAALGTRVELVVADHAVLDLAVTLAREVLDDVDRTCSRFRPDSDLSRANAAAGRRVRVDPLLADALEAALWAARVTDGLVDPTLGAVLSGLGYDRTFRLVVSTAAGHGPTALPAPHPGGAWQALQVDPTGSVLVPAGCALDLGATGKAFAADLIARRLAERTGGGAVVSVGGDVAVAPLDGAQWPVAVGEEPGDPATETVGIGQGGLATSTVLRRRWTRDGVAVHHLVDPRTGRPADTIWRTASVAAQSCVAANTASTAAILLGEDAPAWLRDHDLPARLVARDGTVVRTAGWPADGDPGAAG